MSSQSLNLHVHFLSSNLRQPAQISICSIISFPRRRARRHNHLRPKLPNPLKPIIHKQDQPPSPVKLESMEAGESAVCIAGEDPLHADGHRWFEGGILFLSLRFFALLAVNTVIAFWFLSPRNDQEEKNDRSRLISEGERKVDVRPAVHGDGSEFERKVLEIRAMATKARDCERNLKTVVDGVRPFILSSSKNLVGKNGSLNSKKRDPSVKSTLKNTTSPPKGFGRSKSDQHLFRINGNGDKEVHRDAQATNDPLDFLYSSLNLSLLRNSVVEEVSHSGNKSTQMEMNVGQNSSVTETKQSNPICSIDENYEQELQIEQVRLTSSDGGGGIHEFESNPWWMSLPYVFAIFLHSGSGKDGPSGFYSLNTNSNSGNDDSSSYAVFFQDRGDATNFCYILEAYFEGLGNVSADIVPYGIQDLNDSVKLDGSEVVVIRKGQLNLYSGQPLADAERQIYFLAK